MRRDNIPYVPNVPMNIYPAKSLEEMTLDEIIQKHLKTCGKSNGKVDVCSRCKTPCREGKRAIQLLANQVYNDPPIPLYGGKTLIERAREENMRRRGLFPEPEPTKPEEKDTKMAEENKVEEKKVEEKKKKYTKWDGWWETSLESGDQVKWLLDNMGLTKAKAKKKIYQYRYLHGMTGSPVEEKKDETPTPIVNTTMKAFEEKLDAEPKKEERKTDTIEGKLESLLKKQEEHKKMMDKYMDLYRQEKEEYDRIKQKTDILCSAIDILDN